MKMKEVFRDERASGCIKTGNGPEFEEAYFDSGEASGQTGFQESIPIVLRGNPVLHYTNGAAKRVLVCFRTEK